MSSNYSKINHKESASRTWSSGSTIFFNYRSFLFCIFLGMSMIVSAQSKSLSFKDKNIGEILKSLEKSSNTVFNYDPTALSEYTYSGQLPNGNILTQLTQLFYKTPFTFEQNNDNILIYLEAPKTYQICGTLKDKESGTTLPLANIYLDDQKQGTQSDDNGLFQVEIRAHKHQLVMISYIGYQSQSLMIQAFNQTGCTDFLLKIDATLFGEEIIVKDYILPEITEGETYSGVHIDYQKLAQRQTIIEQDILKTVQLIPGVNSIDESATNLQIRGGTPDQNLILWEDVTLYDPGHLFGMISAINPYVIKKVQVFKGAFDPRYDNRVGGIVDLSLSDSIRQQFHGGVGTTLTEAHAYLQVPLVKNKLSVLLSGRNSINGIYNSPTLQNYSTKIFQGSKIEDQKEEIEEGEVDANQQLDFYDINAKIVFQPTDKITFKTSWLKTQNTFNYQAELFEVEAATVDNVLFDSEALSLSSTFQMRPNWQLDLTFLNSTYSNDYLQTWKVLETDEEILSNNVYNDIKDSRIVWTNHIQLRPNLAVKAGYDYNVKKVNFNVDYSANFEENFADPNFAEGHFHNVFTSFNYQQQNLQINGGLRATYFVEAEHLGYSPRLNLQYAVSNKLKLKISGGILQQYISQLKQFGENALDLNTQVWVLNNQEGEEEEEETVNNLQSAKKIALGFVYHQKGWLIDIEGYYNQTDGLSTLGPSFGTSNVATEIDDFSTGTSKASGIDFLIKKHWRGYQTWLNYSLSSVKFNFPDFYDFSFTASNQQHHNLSFVNSYTYKKWNFSLSYQYKTGLPYTNTLGVGDDSEEVEEPEDIDYFVDYDDPNGQRLPHYSRIDAGISYRPTFKNNNLKAELSFSMINLLNQTNTFQRDFYLDEVENEEEEVIRRQVLGIDKRLLKRTPLVSVRVYW